PVRAIGELRNADHALVDGHAEALFEELADVAGEEPRLGAGVDEDVDLPGMAVDVLPDERASHGGQLAQDRFGGFLGVHLFHRKKASEVRVRAKVKRMKDDGI